MAITKISGSIMEFYFKSKWVLLKHLSQKQYDGIFYDADCNRSPFFREKIVDRVLKMYGVFTYFAPNGTDKYGYDSSLQRDSIIINVPIPKNMYHNDAQCMCPYYINH
jgi:hypothetical protein